MPAANHKFEQAMQRMPAETAKILPFLLHQIYPASKLIHVGTGQGQGNTHQWRNWSVEEALLVDPLAPAWLTSAIAQHPAWHHRPAILAASETNATWYFASNTAESGFIPPNRLQAIWHGIKTLGTEQRQTTTIDKLLTEYLSDWHKNEFGNWLIIDCLPALPILQGAHGALQDCRVLWVRVVLNPDILDMEDAQLSAIQQLLASQQFTLIALTESLHPAVGEAIFIKNCSSKLQVQLKQEAERSKAFDLEVLEKNKALIQCDVFLREKNQILIELNNLQKEKNDFSLMLEAELALKNKALRDLEEMLNEKNSLFAANQALIQEKDALTIAHDVELKAKERALNHLEAMRLEKSQVLVSCDVLQAEKNQLVAERDSLRQENLEVSKACAEQVKLAADRLQALLTLQRETSAMQHRIHQLEADNYENSLLQKHQQEEFIKAEAQIELIKDLLLREVGS